MAVSGGFVVLILAAVLAGRGFAAKHSVGGSQGWDESTDFDSWASAQTFRVGDELEFKYTSGLHSVAELPNESAYKSCDIGVALNSLNGGNNKVKLSKAGTRYFACGTSGHCQQGMKVKITTDANSNSNSNSSSSATAPPADSQSSAADSSQLLLRLFGVIFSSIVFFVIFV